MRLWPTRRACKRRPAPRTWPVFPFSFLLVTSRGASLLGVSLSAFLSFSFVLFSLSFLSLFSLFLSLSLSLCLSLSHVALSFLSLIVEVWDGCGGDIGGSPKEQHRPAEAVSHLHFLLPGVRHPHLPELQPPLCKTDMTIHNDQRSQPCHEEHIQTKRAGLNCKKVMHAGTRTLKEDQTSPARRVRPNVPWQKRIRCFFLGGGGWVTSSRHHHTSHPGLRGPTKGRDEGHRSKWHGRGQKPPPVG